MALPAGVTVRPFAAPDADRLGDIWLAGFADGVPGVTPAHEPDDIRHYMGHVLPGRAEVWVAADAGDRAVGFLALHDDWLEQLYLEPAWIGRGLGHELVTLAQRRRPDGLQLWAFEVNGRARRFYEAHGFVAVERTDGAGNEEKAPDVRYVWPGP